MSQTLFHHALLRPAIIQILRAQGFSGAKPSVVDTLTDIAAKYLMLLAQSSLNHAQISHAEQLPDITDVRMAMVECGLLQPTQTASEEVWTEMLRRPIEDIPERNELQRREAQKRDAEDTEDVSEFVNWFKTKNHREIVRVAGLLLDDQEIAGSEGPQKPLDYLSALKKKHSKAGDDSRFAGTVLGREKSAEDGEVPEVRIDGAIGQPASIVEWQERVKQRQRKLVGIKQRAGHEMDVDDAG